MNISNVPLLSGHSGEVIPIASIIAYSYVNVRMDREAFDNRHFIRPVGSVNQRLGDRSWILDPVLRRAEMSHHAGSGWVR